MSSKRSFEHNEPIRINRYIALCGISSRRGADKLIEQERVQVNGETLTSFGRKVTSEDVVRVDGKRIAPHDFFYILLNKPTSTVTTTDDEHDRRTVLDLIDEPKIHQAGAFPVGRLDWDTTGLLVITNDGVLANRLMHPRYEIEKRYRVETGEPLTDAQLNQLRQGVELEDGPAAADQVQRGNGPRELLMDLHEGRNRQVRRMIAAIGQEVVELERIRYAGLTLKGVARGQWRWLEATEVERLEQELDVR